MEAARAQGKPSVGENKEDGQAEEEAVVRRRGSREECETQPEFLNIMYTNARSVFNKFDELQIVLNDKSPDLFIITESWCNSQITDAMLNIKGYVIEPGMRLDRVDTLNGIMLRSEL